MYTTWKWGNTTSGPWYQFAQINNIGENGSHFSVVDRTLIADSYPNSYGIHNKYIKVCTVPMFNHLGNMGTVMCAPVFWYPY